MDRTKLELARIDAANWLQKGSEPIINYHDLNVLIQNNKFQAAQVILKSAMLLKQAGQELLKIAEHERLMEKLNAKIERDRQRSKGNGKAGGDMEPINIQCTKTR